MHIVLYYAPITCALAPYITLTEAGARFSAASGLRLNEHIEEDGPVVFEHACKLGLEGIVSKRKDSRYLSGRSLHWIKSKNPNAAAVKREAEENWSRRRPSARINALNLQPIASY